jgi:tagatose-1,6-bisphosphate aldolase
MAQINTEQWLAELDMVKSLTPTNSPVVLDRGFTVNDIVDRHEISRTRASSLMVKLVKEGKAKHIGYRNGRNPLKVYEIG